MRLQLHVWWPPNDRPRLRRCPQAKMTDLNQLKAEIDALSEQIKELKTAASVDKDAVGKAVAALLEKKKTYANKNNGIGVDGKAFGEPLTKKRLLRETALLPPRQLKQSQLQR
jgi:hypothetical protein